MNSLVYSLDEIFKGIDITISNPPYSASWEPIESQLMKEIGAIPPRSKADYAFLLNAFETIADTGISAYIVGTGILFRSNKNEYLIRKYLIDKGYIKGIFYMPDNMFMETKIPVAILLLSKKESKNIILIDSTENYIKESSYKRGSNNVLYGKTRNSLSNENIEKIVKAFEEKKEIANFCYVVSRADIAKNNYDLSLVKYKKIEYKPVQYEPTSDILEEIKAMQKETELIVNELSNELGESMLLDLVSSNIEVDNCIRELEKMVGI